jgi:hypothetical protein
MLITKLGIAMDVKPLQFMNAPPPMLTTELGIITEVRNLHPENAPTPMLITEGGITTEVNPAQSPKPSTVVTPSSITTFVI